MSTQELITTQNYSLAPRSFEEAERLANIIAKSSICPSNLRGKAGDVLVILQMGHELRLQPMQALRTLGCINGMPFAYGDGLLALVKRHPEFDDMKEWMEGDISNGTAIAYCTMIRKGKEPQTRSFSVIDATRAGLWKKSGPWSLYPQRMLQHRARGYAAKDVFPDALYGLMSEDEVRNIPQATQQSPKNKGIEGLKSALNNQEEDIVEGSYQVIRTEAEEEIITELLSLISERSISEESQKKWLEKCGAKDFTDIPIEIAKKLITYIKDKK